MVRNSARPVLFDLLGFSEPVIPTSQVFVDWNATEYWRQSISFSSTLLPFLLFWKLTESIRHEGKWSAVPRIWLPRICLAASPNKTNMLPNKFYWRANTRVLPVLFEFAFGLRLIGGVISRGVYLARRGSAAVYSTIRKPLTLEP